LKRDITFDRGDLRLAGHLFTPDEYEDDRDYPALIVQGSFTSVKEQMPGTYAAKLAEAGFVVLAFDYSHYGSSEGLPRQFESPEEKLLDLQAAVTYLESLLHVTGVGMVGVCTSAGNAAYLAARDPRLKAVATVAAFVADSAVYARTYGEDGLARRRADAAEARRKLARTGEPTTVPAYSETDQHAVNYRPQAGAYDYYLNPSRGGVPEYVNAFDVSSWDSWLSFDPISEAKAITIPAMVVHSDGCAFPELARKLYDEMQGEKELVWAEGNHWDFYDSPAQIDTAVTNVARFFTTHLAT